MKPNEPKKRTRNKTSAQPADKPARSARTDPIATAMQAVATVFGERAANRMLQQAMRHRITDRPNTAQLVEMAGKELPGVLKRYRAAFGYAVAKNRKTGKTVAAAASVMREITET